MSTMSKANAKKKAKRRKKTEQINPANLDQILKIENTPDPARKSWHKTCGKKTQLGIMAFWATLFEGNELLSRNKKMTNAEIERQVRLEFPHEETLMENLDSGRQTVNYYRHLYNVGKLTKPRGTPPKHISFRYSNVGKVVDTRSGKRLLTQEEIDELLERYGDA
tara:strand:+ start:5138 stop:5632 length:495 start_codon:yes stop_codon:yes gene_type:complete